MTDDKPVSETSSFDSRYLNRELSWLEFNSRVLAIAEDRELPLLERIKFIAIYGTNLDEFFQVRVAGLKEQVEAGVAERTPDGRSPAEQLTAVLARAGKMVARADQLIVDELLPALHEKGINILRTMAGLDLDDLALLESEFLRRILPVLTPLSVDPAHPFPYVSNLSLNLAAVVRDPTTGVRRFARVKVPPLLSRFIPLPDGQRFLPLEVLIAAHLGDLFPGMEITAHHIFRLTRDADVELEEDEGEDLLLAVESVLRRRRRTDPVRLEIDDTMSTEIRSLLVHEFKLSENDVFVCRAPLDLGAFWGVYRLDRPDLRERPFHPVTPPRLAGGSGFSDIFAALREGDILVHHPYDSFATSVQAFTEQAAADPDVLAIKQTLYRTSAQERSNIRSLIQAAESGKQVAALVEVKARFDEAANIAYARELERAGVHVVYGVVGLKTHAKISLVVRREEGGVRRYAHVGTGNYNPVTARIYEDLGLLTADPDLGADLADLFNLLTGYSRQQQYRQLLVAPHFRQRMVDFIGGQAHPGGKIAMKMNSLVDPLSINALYEASQAGADVSLLVRGICCLRPGVEGMSERIRVRSLVGKYLEHSRVYRFGEGAETTHLIGSADLMERNLDRRVEALVPVNDPALKARLDEILDVLWADDALAWTLEPNGTYTKVPTVTGFNAQEAFQESATARGDRTARL